MTHSVIMLNNYAKMFQNFSCITEFWTGKGFRRHAHAENERTDGQGQHQFAIAITVAWRISKMDINIDLRFGQGTQTKKNENTKLN
jgi:hypothetical protein